MSPLRTPGRVVLLGDSIFDNGVYVPGQPDVITQLRTVLPSGWAASLLAVDGAKTNDVAAQLALLPDDTTDIVLSVGGNDALASLNLFATVPENGGDAIAAFAAAARRFRHKYIRLADLLAQQREGIRTHARTITICTVYTGNMDRNIQLACAGGIALFNDVIQRTALYHRWPVLELRDIFTRPADYANPIEPSVRGGAKLAEAIKYHVTGSLLRVAQAAR